MKYTDEKIINNIYNAIDIFNLNQVDENKLEKSLNEVLFGRKAYTKTSKLDSLTLVYFIFKVEEIFQNENQNFNLNSEKLLESKEKHLKDISSLASYIKKLKGNV